MSDGPDLPGWRLRVLDYIGLGFLLLVAEEVMRHPNVWYSWLVPLAIGVVLLWLGDAAPTVWKWLLAKWRAPKALTTALAENVSLKSQLTELCRENSELYERLEASKGILALPAPKQTHLVKPLHNVQCTGFAVSSDDDDSISQATLIFRNVRTTPDQLLGKFDSPHLRVIYYDNSTGQEIADLGPLLWQDPNDGPSEINASESHALVASYYEAQWHACEIIEPEEGSYVIRNKYRWIELPVGEVQIKASLYGGFGNLRIPEVTGILNLHQDGTASFRLTSA